VEIYLPNIYPIFVTLDCTSASFVGCGKNWKDSFPSNLTVHITLLFKIKASVSMMQLAKLWKRQTKRKVHKTQFCQNVCSSVAYTPRGCERPVRTKWPVVLALEAWNALYSCGATAAGGQVALSMGVLQLLTAGCVRLLGRLVVYLLIY
jgi:hypothetical protein